MKSMEILSEGGLPTETRQIVIATVASGDEHQRFSRLSLEDRPQKKAAQNANIHSALKLSWESPH
jgi:hypothetical protein